MFKSTLKAELVQSVIPQDIEIVVRAPSVVWSVQGRKFQSPVAASRNAVRLLSCSAATDGNGLSGAGARIVTSTEPS